MSCVKPNCHVAKSEHQIYGTVTCCKIYPCDIGSMTLVCMATLPTTIQDHCLESATVIFNIMPAAKHEHTCPSSIVLLLLSYYFISYMLHLLKVSLHPTFENCGRHIFLKYNDCKVHSAHNDMSLCRCRWICCLEFYLCIGTWCPAGILFLSL